MEEVILSAAVTGCLLILIGFEGCSPVVRKRPPPLTLAMVEYTTDSDRKDLSELINRLGK